MNFNKAIIAGNITRDPEKKVTDSGTTIVNFSVASNRHYTDGNGQKQQETEFHNVVFFGKTAENIAKYMKKGSQILVEGRIQTRNWEDKNGTKRYRTEIIGQNVQFGHTPDNNESKKEEPPVIEEDEDVNVDDIPF